MHTYKGSFPDSLYGRWQVNQAQSLSIFSCLCIQSYILLAYLSCLTLRHLQINYFQKIQFSCDICSGGHPFNSKEFLKVLKLYLYDCIIQQHLIYKLHILSNFHFFSHRKWRHCFWPKLYNTSTNISEVWVCIMQEHLKMINHWQMENNINGTFKTSINYITYFCKK